ncbi:MAG TPA: hypothetical protein VEW48_11705 [Thermoanaerobaculia bacterium]|nr:hypothetical protein [Thermoanaerobaculia bacterium]
MRRPTSDTGADQAQDSMIQLLSRLAPDAESLLASHGLTHEEAESALQELLTLLTYRWDQLESPEVWTLATLKRLCLRCSVHRAVPSDL